MLPGAARMLAEAEAEQKGGGRLPGGPLLAGC